LTPAFGDLLPAMGEIAIFLSRFLQAVDDAMAPAAVTVTVLLGKFRHPLAAPHGPAAKGPRDGRPPAPPAKR
jgi:hypothetical protein